MIKTEQLSSKTKHLKRTLTILKYENAYKALDLVIKEMCVDKGFSRHNGEHYYHHLVDVAQLLLNFGIKDEVTITAAILHDYLEDVEGATPEEISAEFGYEVTEIVKLVTKEKGVDYKTNHEAMMDYLDAIFLNPKACLVKTADRVNNFQTMRDSSINHRRKQLDNTMKYFIPFFKKCRNKYIENENFYFQAKTTIEPIAFEIGRYLEDLSKYEDKVNKQAAEISRLKTLLGENKEVIK